MNTRLFLLLALCVGLCWGCVSAPKKPSPEPEFAMETFLPPPILDLGPKTHSGFEPVNESKEPNTKASILPPPQESVHFEFNQSKPNDREWDVLKNHGEYLLQNPNVRARLEGNTDENGSDEYNLQLGQKRAQAVKDSLIKMGVEDERLEPKSWGKTQPLNPAHQREAWRQNRRVDIRYFETNSISKETNSK